MWRKNRRINDGDACVGVDTNRNFDVDFGGIGSSSEPCSNVHHGPHAFSEKESQALRDLLMRLGREKRIRSFVSIHAYAQRWMSPYISNFSFPPDYAKMERVMKAATDAIRATNGFDFSYGPGAQVWGKRIFSGSCQEFLKFLILSIFCIFRSPFRDKHRLGVHKPKGRSFLFSGIARYGI